MARIRTPGMGQLLMKHAETSPRYYAYTRRRCELMKTYALAYFNAAQRHDNEHRDSPTTPPKYVDSFIIIVDAPNVYLYNRDPTAMWVEWGALVGGNFQGIKRVPPRVLRYKPMTKALDALAAQTTRGI